MKKIVNENYAVVRKEVSREEAQHIFAHDSLKLELLEAIPADELVTVYTSKVSLLIYVEDHMYRRLINCSTLSS